MTPAWPAKRPGELRWGLMLLTGGLLLLVVASLPTIGALRLVFGVGILWVLMAALLILLGIAGVIRYAARLQQHHELSVAKLAMQDGGAILSPDDVHFDLALKQFLIASRHQRLLSCIAIEIAEESLQHLLDEAGWEVAPAALEASAMGLAAMATAETTRRSDLTIKGSAPRQLVVLCPETNRAGALRVAQKLDQALSQDLGLVVRVGVSTFPADASSLKELLERAESELRHSDGLLDRRQLVLEFPGWEVYASEADRPSSPVHARSA